MGNYTVYNETGVTIFWRDGSWLSGDLEAGKSKNVETNHDATVTMFSKDSSGEHEWGIVTFPKDNGICKVKGEWKWEISKIKKANGVHMGNYTVYNETGVTIFWRDGSWLSGDLEAGKSKNVETNHDATVTMFSKDSSGEHEWGIVTLPKDNGICKVKGEWKWEISKV